MPCCRHAPMRPLRLLADVLWSKCLSVEVLTDQTARWLRLRQLPVHKLHSSNDRQSWYIACHDIVCVLTCTASLICTLPSSWGLDNLSSLECTIKNCWHCILIASQRHLTPPVRLVWAFAGLQGMQTLCCCRAAAQVINLIDMHKWTCNYPNSEACSDSMF